MPYLGTSRTPSPTDALSGILFFKQIIRRVWEIAHSYVLMPFRAFCFLNSKNKSLRNWRYNAVLMPFRAFCFLNFYGSPRAMKAFSGLNALSGILFFKLYGCTVQNCLVDRCKVLMPFRAFCFLNNFCVNTVCSICAMSGLNALSGILFFKLKMLPDESIDCCITVLMPFRAFCFLNE